MSSALERVGPTLEALLQSIAAAWRCSVEDFDSAFVHVVQQQLLEVYRRTLNGDELATPLHALLLLLARRAALSLWLLDHCLTAVLDVYSLAQDERDTGRWQIPPKGVNPQG